MVNATRRANDGIGRGRSKSIYIEPEIHDTAVLIAFFNPAKYKRILKNVLYIIKILAEQHIPVYVIECVFGSEKPQIPNPTLVVHSNSYMFYKEQLMNKLEPLIPEKYTKLVFLDADILFDTPDWIDQISTALDKYDIIQPFNQACWLTPDNSRIRSKKMSYAFAIVTKKTLNTQTVHHYHPGFAWAIKRDIFRKIGGFFPRSVIGGGDVTFVLNLFPIQVTDELFFIGVPQQFGKVIIEAWRAYNDAFKKVNPTLGFLANRALHLFHGVKENRQYVSRFNDISKVMTKTWDEEITTNKDGLFEFRNPEVNSVLLKYFKRRNEDIPLEEAESIVQGGKKVPVIARGGSRRRRRSVLPESSVMGNSASDE